MFKLQSFPEFDSSDSASSADDQRIVLMKGALLSELVQQPCILKVFAHWAVAITDIVPPQAAQAVAHRLGPDAVQLVQAVGLPYGWVAQGLLHGFVAGIEALVAGEEIVLPLPQINVTYDPTKKRPVGRKSDPAVIERYTKWYVRCRIGGVKESALAQEYHEAYHKAHYHKHTWKEDRETIIDGIKTIDRLLKLTHSLPQRGN